MTQLRIIKPGISKKKKKKAEQKPGCGRDLKEKKRKNKNEKGILDVVAHPQSINMIILEACYCLYM